MMPNDKNALVGTDWLADHSMAPDIRLVDARWVMPGSDHSGRDLYRTAHIPGAVFFDIDEIADPSTGLPHSLPSAEKFASRVRKLGVGDGNKIVIYDQGAAGFGSAARVWWMFRVFGARDVVVLDGGFARWQAEGHATDDIPPIPRERHFTARYHDPLTVSLPEMQALVADGATQIIDTRPADRFGGQVPEPRPGLRAGHMPGAINLPFSRFHGDDGGFLPPDALAQLFSDAGLDPGLPTVTSCGSGVSACLAALALYQVGNPQVAVYDGSWTEWGARQDVPIVTSPALVDA